MRVGLDFDGVISDTIPSMIEFARVTHGLHLSPLDCVAPDGPAGLGSEVWLRLITDTHATPYALSMPPMFGTADGLARLSDRHEVVVVTARRGGALENTRIWLDHHGLAGHVADIVSSAGKTKADIAHELGLALLVDDVIENLHGLCGPVVPVLWDAIYNRDALVDTWIRRVSGWSDVTDLVRTLAAIPADAASDSRLD